MKYRKDIFLSKTRPPIRATRILIHSPPFRVKLVVESHALTKAHRHQLAIAMARTLSPHLSGLATLIAHHSEGAIKGEKFRCRFRASEALTISSPAEVLGMQVRLRRLEMNLSQRELGEKAGIEHTHLSRLEHGQYYPQLATLRKLEVALEMEFRHFPRRYKVATQDRQFNNDR